MKCDGCVSSVESALRQVPGVISVTVSLEEAEARVTLERPVSPDDLADAVAAAGYEAVPAD